MQLDAILSIDRSKARLDGVSKKRLFETLATTFVDSIPDFDIDSVYQSLINREKLGTTGIGEGVAIPHCRFATGGKTYAACLSLSTPIDFDSVDGSPVDLVVAMLVPENAENAHLELLATLAEKLQQEAFVKRLRDANSDQTLYEAAVSPVG